jgi:hypothetical protein
MPASGSRNPRTLLTVEPAISRSSATSRPTDPQCTLSVIGTGAAAAALGPLAWNAILRSVGGREFFVDAPILVFPVSWQDTGSGVLAFAAASLLLAGPLNYQPAKRAVTRALLVGLAALLVDIYLY